MRMIPALRRLALLIPAAAVLAMAADADMETLRRSFENPPDDARIMMRWWWFGPGVTKTEIERELRAMKAGGMGGAEVQPVYPMALDDPETGFHNIRYLSDEFLDVLRFTSEKARELGLRLDLTLGSGWPFGGPHIPVTQAAGMLRCDRVPVPPGASSVRMPYLENGEKLLAVFVAKGDAKQFAPTGIRQIPIFKGDWQPVGGDAGEPRVALFFISSRTGQMVKRAAVGAEGYVLDHYDRSAIENHLKNVGDRLMQAFGANPPYAVFSDSLEVFGSDWTPNLLDEFRRRRGYDLTPYLPALVGDIGAQTGAIRHDWGQTLYELADDNYLRPVTEWAHQHGTRFRSQTYGMPPVTLSSNALVDLPEGEGTAWRRSSATRTASSASHLYGRPVTSTETWTYLHSPVFRATPLDMKSQADLYFLQGSNQLIGHGWPYSPPAAGEPGWRFYAAAVFDDHNPWWIVMPDVTKYLQRISFLLRQGKPVNDVAIYVATADNMAQFQAGRERIGGITGGGMGSNVEAQVLDAGFNFDFIDDEAIAQVGVPYPVLILPNVERMPLATLRIIQAYAEEGGKVLATRRTPSLAPGLAEAESDTPRIRELARTLLEAAGARGKFLKDEQALGKELAALYAPDVRIRSDAALIGVVHRKVAAGEIYFIVNTANTPVHTQAAFRVQGLKPEWWDPFSGKRSAARTASGESAAVALDLLPYESRVLVYSANALAPAPGPEGTAASTARAPLDLSSDWKVTFGNGRTAEMRELRSWTDTEETRFFSGQATYEKTVDLPEAWVRSGGEVYLNFGVGKPAAQDRRGGAAIESPVREAAQVYINGSLAGSVWKPPYEVDATGLLRAGANTIRVVVANLGINRLAGMSPPNYRLLNLRYGERFQEQDLQNVQPVPCGMLGPVRLTAR
jgi:hypothetical protein